MPAFLVAIDLINDVPRLCLKGNMIFGQNLRQLLDPIKNLARAGQTRVVVDLTEVELADSSGIAALLDTKRILGETTSTVLLVRPSPQVRNGLDLTRATSMFQIVADEVELRAHL